MGRIFGTNGVRGTINDGLTVDMVLDLSRAVGTTLKGTVAISRDSRLGGEMFSRAVISGLLSTGCSIIDLGPMPTPGLQFMVPRLDCVAGVMVTASHNPPQFNGIKVMGSNGIEVSRKTESKIEDAYFKKTFTQVEWDEIGTVDSYETAISEYIQGIKSHVDVSSIKERNLTVVVDGANSVGSLVTPILMRELGCKVISINAQMDGHFPGRDPEPLPKNLQTLSNVVRSIGADVGVAHDGDADRATFVDSDGNILWGDQSFALIASRVLARKKESTLITPVSSGKLIEDIAEETDAKIIWTEVGSVVVSHKLLETGAELGGEENGGVFYPPHLCARDGAMTAAQIVEILATENKTLSKLVDELPTYFSTKIKVAVPIEKKSLLLEPLLEITSNENRITIDGVKLMYDTGWVLMRPSGTEPLWRVFAEAKTQDESDRLAEKGRNIIEAALSKI
ncbi:MAG: Phosphoglucomutase/phosphomannomutase [Candidatus Thorarchaeota archaeon]|nr:MAG: Phosphoglucomutase/phosphomannomutase [Candidatus Thorarchaeota archaeon]